MDTPTYRTSALLLITALSAALSGLTLVAIALFLQLPRPMMPLSLTGALSLSLCSFVSSVTAMHALARENSDRVVPSRWGLAGPGLLAAAYMFLTWFAMNRLLGLHSWF